MSGDAKVNEERHLVRGVDAKQRYGETGVSNIGPSAPEQYANTGMIQKSGPKMSVDIVDLEMAEKIDANIENIRVRVESQAKTIK